MRRPLPPVLLLALFALLLPARAEEEGPTPQPIQLPADERPHDCGVEWWYYTGLLETEDGGEVGFEAVVFQVALGPRHLVMYHHALTDVDAGTFAHEVRTELRKEPVRSKEGFAFEVKGWTMAGHEGKDRVALETEEHALDLRLVAEKPPVLQYGDGAMRIGSEEPFYYYSYTRIRAEGTLRIGDEDHEVRGTAWMDHQWGEIGQDSVAWDWWSLRLDDRTEVMLFIVHDQEKDGETERTPGFVGGTLVAADGSYEELTPADFHVEATGSWTSDRTGATYPQGWKIRVPKRDLAVTVTPVLADQEVASPMKVRSYWEGLCRVTGTSGEEEVRGHAYVELVGYADRPR